MKNVLFFSFRAFISFESYAGERIQVNCLNKYDFSHEDFHTLGELEKQIIVKCGSGK